MFWISLRAEQSAPLYPTCDTLIVARNVNLNTGIFHLNFLTVDKNISYNIIIKIIQKSIIIHFTQVLYLFIFFLIYKLCRSILYLINTI